VVSGQLEQSNIYLKANILPGCHMRSLNVRDMERIGLDQRCPSTSFQAHLNGIPSEFLHPLLHLKAAEPEINNLAIRNH
jgi:hypothetical protein